MDWSCPFPIQDYPRVLLAHGGGGRLMQQLLEKMVFAALSNPALDARTDSAALTSPGEHLAFTTDSYVVQPLFFPGGDIGTLAVCGTCNDLAMAGARARYLSLGLILEEGLEMELLWRVLCSIRDTAAEAGVAVVTGDTKVVERGKGDQIFINTSGIGERLESTPLGPHGMETGDVVLLSGDVGRHGIAVMASREGLAFETALESDCGLVGPTALGLIEAGVEVHAMRDLTRGGLGAALSELALASGHEVRVEMARLPVHDAVRGACELLGLSPMHVACEGRFVACVAKGDAERALSWMQSHDRRACVLGRVGDAGEGRVLLEQPLGATRVLTMPSGAQLPRIC